MPPRCDPVSPDGDRERIVELQLRHGGPPGRGDADDPRPAFTPAEVFAPLLPARVVERNAPAAHRVKGVNRVTLECVAEPAGQPEVILIVRASLPDGNDVFDLQPA